MQPQGPAHVVLRVLMIAEDFFHRHGRPPAGMPEALEILLRMRILSFACGGLEVSLCTEQQKQSVLVPEFVHGCRLADRSAGRRDRTGVLLIKMGIGQIAREGQILDRRPAGNRTKLRDVVVRIATGDAGSAKYGAERAPDAAHSTDQRLRGAVVLHGSVRTIDGRIPEWIPVVRVRAAHAPGLYQLLLSADCEY